MGQGRVLVTGGAGFIGRHLCDRLLSDGYEVTCVDDLSTSSPQAISALRHHPHFHFINGDVREPLSLEVDRIFHLACPASPRHYSRDPIRTLTTAVMGTKMVLDLARQQDARVLITSTSEVYGDPHLHPQSENYWGNVNPIGPRSCYDEGKRAAEALAVDYARHASVKVKIVRLFNTYGPGMSLGDGRVVPTFINDSLTGVPIRIHGDGRQTRSFCYVADVVEALVRMMDAPASITGPINIGNPHEIAVADLAALIQRRTGTSSSLVFVGRPQDDPERRQPDISRAKNLLNWSPAIDLETGIDRTIAYFRRLQAPTYAP